MKQKLSKVLCGGWGLLDCLINYNNRFINVNVLKNYPIQPSTSLKSNKASKYKNLSHLAELTWRKTTWRLRSASSCLWSSINTICSLLSTTLFSSSFFSLSLVVSFSLSQTLPFKLLKICPFASNGLRVSDWKTLNFTIKNYFVTS